MINLKSLSEEDLFEFIKDNGLPQYRAKQLLHRIYEKNVTGINQISEFSRDLRIKLAGQAWISCLDLVTSEKSRDGTVKYLFELEDGERIESVLIPDGQRLTLCISSQAGCAMGCRFCLTGKSGFRRNLKSYEIIDQVLSVNRFISPYKITNIVFMGMGEPLMNLDNVSKAITIINKHVKISRRRITVSTAGVSPGIIDLAQQAPLVNLAVSLNAPDDKTRSLIMPVNMKYGIDKLIQACRNFPLPSRRRITFEYVLIRNLNDSQQHAEAACRILKGIPSKVNLIPFNPVPGIEFKRPDGSKVLAFQRVLLERRITAIIRKSKGADISAACGQLSGK
ncbi:MAG TPA: 23S rRNA (adenine(2503)-C(2))-methyltransferase RlmN [Nitrospirae bacterium]|nr:23S rRNA (adenine(2503)-C(2))-methyltransferase RlmN [Nitrospirota bacterium]HDO23028.1 23S rRNA (adenine(2503)-C(2))-methyltransferase RlmN [Nitrospirota bacterium]HDZ87308.1 23S rRNA (adenine(2503)-C(2))-methyltransferase RlmN [Nitrospirota bacterium]